MHEQQVDFQLVPPHLHQRNSAERTICTFKNHFISGLCSTYKNLPLHLWDRLLPQALFTLNLLRGSRINPNLSAYAQVHGLYDFNCTPIAPRGIQVLVHENTSQRTSWAPHAVDGWYVVPALNSYCCYKLCIWETCHQRICDTLIWFPTKVTMPLSSSTNIIKAVANNIIQALANPLAQYPQAPLTDR